MDVDNGASGSSCNGPSSVDLEQSLLQQFSCLGTTDKDELVQQLRKLLGSDLNESTAAFFLDMNNWNLQAAICSYLDIQSPDSLPKMTLMSEPNTNDSESVDPNTSFQKVWNVVNSGKDPWPAGCYAQRSDGDDMGGTRAPLPCLLPGQQAQVVVQLRSPSVPGLHQAKWRLCTSEGAYFGDPLWVIVTVLAESTVKLTEQLSHLNALGSSPPPTDANPFTAGTIRPTNSHSSSKDDSSSNDKNGMW